MRLGRTLRRRRGNGVLEASLVLPVLLSLSMGALEFGYFMYAKHTCQAASRDGARTAILSSSTHSQATSAVTNTMSSGKFASGTYTTAFTNSSGNTISDVSTIAKGSSITVTVSTTAGQVGIRPLGFIPASKTIVGTTTMIKE